MRAKTALCCLALATLSGCARVTPAPAPITVAVHVSGDEAIARAWPERFASAAVPGVVFRRADAPNIASVGDEPAVVRAAREALAVAPRSFAEADFARCSRALSELSVDALLAAGRRDLAGRMLLWSVACALADERTEDARIAAARIATSELEVPSVVTRPDVEELVGETLANAGRAARSTLSVTATAPDARVDLDGREGVCRAPCEVALVPGPHVLAVSADRFEPRWQVVRVEGARTTARVTLTPASAETAAAQWSARATRGAATDSAESMALLAIATRAQRLASVQLERESRGTRLRAALVERGAITARSERRATGPARDEDGVALLRELLVRGGVVEPARPVYASPWFWVAVGAAASAGTAVTAWFFTRPIETRIGFDGG
jgi:hypothetical protein